MKDDKGNVSGRTGIIVWISNCFFFECRRITDKLARKTVTSAEGGIKLLSGAETPRNILVDLTVAEFCT